MKFLEAFFEKNEKTLDFFEEHKTLVLGFGYVFGFIGGLAIVVIKSLIFAFCFFWVASLF